MNSSLIIFGVIFLVIGGLLYIMPMQVLTADTTTAGNGGTDSRTSSARVTVPVEWAYASAIIGFVLLLFGLVIPNPSIKNDSNLRSDSKNHSYKKVVESKENFDVGDGNKRRIVRKRIETHNARRDDY